ncbi:TrmB family transcriptional regulator [Streptomyces sp. SS1-1]|uniref:helix-turn-helix transcriptional regulator n=1 Tax=Streptomyces sp. SS1-1 TaxID=2651869 RepID=UPI00124FBA78|nr:LuxR family transcriptional regulator [Streptomyces sp. SS1-1]KAB2977564.1 TrmB family transcriptional regulator [Streptomyces sp. SS1-1]
MTLEVAGLSPAEEAVYRVLVTEGRVPADYVMRRTALSRPAVELTLAVLTSQGLASRTDKLPFLYWATPPDVALTPRLKRHAEALELARNEVAGLLEAYQDTLRRQDTSQLIELVTGTESLRQHLRHIQSASRSEMLWFCKPQYVAMPAGSNDAEFEALSRGVNYRVLYEKAYFDDEGAVDNVARAVRAGEIARAVPHLPLRLAIADRSIAVCPLVPGGSHGSPGPPTAALIRDGSLVSALTALFERYWEDAIPLSVDGSGNAGDIYTAPQSLSVLDRKLLSLLVAGLGDKAIATQTGLSRRTVQRYVQRMMQLAGATTRMQLAWQAARRGWL